MVDAELNSLERYRKAAREGYTDCGHSLTTVSLSSCTRPTHNAPHCGEGGTSGGLRLRTETRRQLGQRVRMKRMWRESRGAGPRHLPRHEEGEG